MCNLRKSKAAALALTLTLTLGLPLQGSCKEQESAKAEETQPGTAEAAPETSQGTPSNEIKTLDAAAVRPVSLTASLFSTGTFLLSLPFAAFDPAIGPQKSWENLIDYPYGYTFKRPLGDFSGSVW